MPRIHVSSVGTYHPDPTEDVAWTVNDTRGYTDGGPSCDVCGACECFNEETGETGWKSHYNSNGSFEDMDHVECVGLSFCYVCMESGLEALCESCGRKAGIEIVECDCK